MAPELIVFLVLGAVAVGSALGMLMSRNAVYSAMFLIMNFATVAVFYLVLGAPFIAMVQVTVYAGAIMVLFLFVIMLLGAEHLERRTGLDWQKPIAVVLGLVLLVEAGYVLASGQASLPAIAIPEAGYGAPAQIGELLFSQYLLPFEVTSVLLLAAMIGAIVITRRDAPKRKKN
ncbi:MAG: NADH-quinone oxidoreductase subunit J [Anaerolineae bacterium]|nr:MAG: NADH-quinone oxidoreductase subunit J [Anaerolineae bacterium]